MTNLTAQPPRPDTTARLAAMRLPELQALASDLGLTGVSQLRKGALVDLISEFQEHGNHSSNPVGDDGDQAPTAPRPAVSTAPAKRTPRRATAAAGIITTTSVPTATDRGAQSPAADAGRISAASHVSGAQTGLRLNGSDQGDQGRDNQGQGTPEAAGSPAATAKTPTRSRASARIVRAGNTEGAEAGTDTAGPAAAVDHAEAAGSGSGDSDDSSSAGSASDASHAGSRAEESGDGGPRGRNRNRNRNERQQGERQQGERQQGADRGGDQDGTRNRNTNDRNNADRSNADRNNADRNNADRNNADRSGGERRSELDSERVGRNRYRDRKRRGPGGVDDFEPEISEDDVLIPVAGILDILDNYAFVRTSGYLPGNNDVYVSLGQVKKYTLRKGDAIVGSIRQPRENDNSGRQKYNAIVRIDSVNGLPAEEAANRVEFGKLTPLYPQERLRLETEPNKLTTRIIDLMSPIGKGQRGLIVSPPKAGKTLVLQAIANAISKNNPEVHLMVVLVDERPEEVTDMQR
ncbi:MAG: Rho termination factor N-terminal domain-containing protein, partial [Microbacteriaceae bacterium]